MNGLIVKADEDHAGEGIRNIWCELSPMSLKDRCANCVQLSSGNPRLEIRFHLSKGQSDNPARFSKSCEISIRFDGYRLVCYSSYGRWRGC
jgi:hypothetical protein